MRDRHILFTGLPQDRLVLSKPKKTTFNNFLDFSKTRRFTTIIYLVNHIFTVIMTVIALRFTLLIFGVGENLFYSFSSIFIRPVFFFLGTSPVYGSPHVEREALIALAIYAVLSPLIASAIGLYREIERFRGKLNEKESCK